MRETKSRSATQSDRPQRVADLIDPIATPVVNHENVGEEYTPRKHRKRKVPSKPHWLAHSGNNRRKTKSQEQGAKYGG